MAELTKSIPEHNILILNHISDDADFLTKLSSPKGTVYTASNLEEAIPPLKNININVAIIDSSMARYSHLRGFFLESTSIIITGQSEAELLKIANDWPQNFHVDTISTKSYQKDNTAFLLTFEMAVKHSLLTNKVKALSLSREQNNFELKEAFSQIAQIKNFVERSALKELEKRITVETKYNWLKREKQRIEDILIKLYRANDVTSLLDIVFDIKGLIRSNGISFYLLDKNGAEEKHLKPLVWNNHIPSHEDIADLNVNLDSTDFAADSVSNQYEINTSEFEFDNRLSSRYINYLDYPLKSILCVPIRHDEEIIGVLEVYNKENNGKLQKDGFSKEDQQILRKLSEHISIAINKLNLIQFDALTGLLRPEPFLEKTLQKLKSGNKRHEEKSSFSLVMGDVDWFKYYNDRNGHEAGNKLLRELAGILRSSVRGEDILCRYGGEEFLFLLNSIKNKEESLVFTDRIKKSIEDNYFESQEFQPRNNLTMSFGITNFSLSDFSDTKEITLVNLKELIIEADKALAEAKGKKNTILFDKKDTTEVPEKNRICIFRNSQEEENIESDQNISSEKPEIEEKRKHPRYFTSTPLIYRNSFKSQVTKTINLSLGGVKIASEKHFSSGTQLDLILLLGKTALECKGYVIHSEKNKSNLPSYLLGLKFSELSLNDRKVLNNYLTSIPPANKSTFN